jgi:hypothetical protein
LPAIALKNGFGLSANLEQKISAVAPTIVEIETSTHRSPLSVKTPEMLTVKGV